MTNQGTTWYIIISSLATLNFAKGCTWVTAQSPARAAASLSIAPQFFSASQLLLEPSPLLKRTDNCLNVSKMHRNDSEVSDQKASAVTSCTAFLLAKSFRSFLARIAPEKALLTQTVLQRIRFMLSTEHYLVLGSSRAVVFKGKDVAAPLALMRGLMNLVFYKLMPKCQTRIIAFRSFTLICLKKNKEANIFATTEWIYD